MPSKPPRPCSICGVLVMGGGTRCEAHRSIGRFGDKSRGSRHQRGYGSAWDRTRRRVIERDRGLCQACLKVDVLTPGTDVDHVIPKARGGADDDRNLQLLCRACHRAKTARE